MQDFESLWKRAAYAWAKSKVSDGADNVDAWRTNSTFKDYYDRYGLSTSNGSPQYNTTTNKVSVDGVYSQTYTNNTDQQTSGDFTYSDAVTNTLSVAITEGLQIAQSESVKVGLEGLGDVSSSLTVTVNISSTQTVTNSETKTWSVHQQIPEPPHSVTKATFTVEKNTLAGSVTVPVVISGRVAVGLNSRWNGHYFWFVPIAQLLTDTNNTPSWLKINGDGSVTFNAVYSMNGVAASNAYVTLDRVDPSGTTSQKVQIAHPNTVIQAA
ncbi:ETX/MTX2 family pore-forming toxin [Pendulispora albinea]|uniref:ETX/MTX2 family pore-forming toxin n=1 Tax=Pendulispora albinea TaxID=2741071 RepID=A0ABZ2MCL9_9BACT